VHVPEPLEDPLHHRPAPYAAASSTRPCPCDPIEVRHRQNCAPRSGGARTHPHRSIMENLGLRLSTPHPEERWPFLVTARTRGSTGVPASAARHAGPTVFPGCQCGWECRPRAEPSA
jgi:hypothetical protein